MSERINERVEGYKPYSFMKDLEYIETYKGKYRIYSFNDTTIDKICVFCPEVGSILDERNEDYYKGTIYNVRQNDITI